MHQILPFFFIFVPIMLIAQAEEGSMSRGSIPEDLLRPNRGESPRYPVDTVIGEMGRGEASSAAYSFARSVAAGLVTGKTDHSGLNTISPLMLEGYLSALEAVNPRSYRLGSGREEPDGAFSFLNRFIGRVQAITGELFVRPREQQGSGSGQDAENASAGRIWVFEELILEEARDRESEQEKGMSRSDFFPYERFY